MTLNEYQHEAVSTAIYPNKSEIGGLTYTILGLCGEAGELANKLKKHIRSGTSVDSDVLVDELGDVLWYVAAVARELGVPLDEVGQMNLRKLYARKTNGTLANR